MIRLKHILVFFIVAFAVKVKAQSNIDLAYKNFKEKNYKAAQEYIDKVIHEEGINKDPQVWQLRALIYKRLTNDLGIGARDTAFSSLDVASQLDTDGAYKDKIQGYRKNLIIEYYNDAVKLMDKGDCETSEKSYSQYKDLYKEHLGADKDFHDQDIEFYLALSSKYESVAKSKTDAQMRMDLLEKSLESLQKVLDLDTKNYEANLRVGIHHYNRGVYLILSLTPDVKLEDCIETNRKSVEIFNEALPYFLTAYEANPNKKEIIEGLAGIYTNLNDKGKAKEFVELLKQFEK